MTWFAGHCLSAEPLSVYLLTDVSEASDPTDPSAGRTLLRKLRMSWLQDTRPLGMASAGSARAHHDKLALSNVPDPDLGRPDERGQRGKLIMAAEKNKKALEDGTYGVGTSGSVEALGGQGPPAPPVTDLAGLRTDALLDKNGNLLPCDSRGGGQTRGNATAVYERRQKRLDTMPALSAIRQGRLQAIKLQAARKVAETKGATAAVGAETNKAVLVGSSQSLPSPEGSKKASWEATLVDIRYKRIQNASDAKLEASRKRARPQGAEAAEIESAVSLTNPDRKDPAAQARERERVLQARKRKILDFYGRKAPPKKELPEEAGGSDDRDAIGGPGKKDMTEEEKEMLEVLKGIGKPSAVAQAGGALNDALGAEQQKPKRPKIKDPRRTADIAAARIAVLSGK